MQEPSSCTDRRVVRSRAFFRDPISSHEDLAHPGTSLRTTSRFLRELRPTPCKVYLVLFLVLSPFALTAVNDLLSVEPSPIFSSSGREHALDTLFLPEIYRLATPADCLLFEGLLTIDDLGVPSRWVSQHHILWSEPSCMNECSTNRPT